MEHRAPTPRWRSGAVPSVLAIAGAVLVALVALVVGLPRFGGGGDGPDGSSQVMGGETDRRPRPATEGADAETRGGRLGATRLEEVRLLLDRNADAVLDQDAETYHATIDPDPVSAGFAETALRTYRNLVEMDAVALTYDELVEDDGALTPQRREALGPDAFVVEALMRLQMAGPDADLDAAGDHGKEWVTRLRFVVVERDGELYLAGDREGRAEHEALPLWLLDEVAMVTGERSRVIGAGDSDRLWEYAEAADQAVVQVDEVWSEPWDGHVVIIAPWTQEQMETVIGADEDSQTAVAAVTTSVGRADPAMASHVVVNPTAFGEVGGLGRLVVLTHETTHVATMATVSRLPMWLSEGFADYVGFRDSGLEVDSIAGELLGTVRLEGPPVALPDNDDFDPVTHGLDAAYEGAWLACRYIAERWDESTLVELYVAVEAADPDGQAEVLADILGIGQAQFVSDYSDYVTELAQ